MILKEFLSICVLILSLNLQLTQSAECEYYDEKIIYTKGYSCRLSLTYSNESTDGITQINGEHLSWRKNHDVIAISKTDDLKLQKIPSIACKKFAKLQGIWLNNVGIEEIGNDSLKNCKNLVYLDLPTNKIKKISENAFANNKNLKLIYLYGNDIEELPRKVFAPLTKLFHLWLNGNKLKTLHSDSFGRLDELSMFRFQLNDINAIDEKLIVKCSKLTQVEAGPNPCVSKYKLIIDNATSIVEIKSALKRCFVNYKRDFPSTRKTTSTTTRKPRETTEIKLNKSVIQISNEESLNINTLQEDFKCKFQKLQIENKNSEWNTENGDIQSVSEQIRALSDKNDQLTAKFDALIKAVDEMKVENDARNQGLENKIEKIEISIEELKKMRKQ